MSDAYSQAEAWNQAFPDGCIVRLRGRAGAGLIVTLEPPAVAPLNKVAVAKAKELDTYVPLCMIHRVLHGGLPSRRWLANRR